MKVTFVIEHLRPGGAERQAFEAAHHLQSLGVQSEVVGLSGPRLLERNVQLLDTEYNLVSSVTLGTRASRIELRILGAVSKVLASSQERYLPWLRRAMRRGPSERGGPNAIARQMVKLVVGGEGFGSLSIDELVGIFLQRSRVVFQAGLLLKHLRKNQPDLLVSFLRGPNLVSAVAGQILDIPVVVSERNDVARDGSLDRPDPLVWSLYSSASLVTANTEVATRDLAGVFGDSEVRWFPNQSSYREVLSGGSRAGARHVVVMARLAPQKNTAAVIESLAQGYLLEHETKLSVFGSGRELGRLRRLSRRLGVDPRVHFFGYRPLSEIWGLIDGVGFAVVNSAFEGSSNSLHEAVRMGLVPVVASTVREVGDIVSPELAERIVTDGSAESIAEVVGRLCRSEEFYGETWGLVQRDFGAYWVRASRVREEFFRDLLGKYSTS